jgi:putative hydrolase of the HAD superfamily
MPYRYLLFDADDTLFDFKKAQSSALERSFLDLTGHYEGHYLKVYEEINLALWQDFERGEISQSELKDRRFVQFLARLELSLEPAHFNQIYLQRLSEGQFLFEGALELIQDLSTGYKLLLITNGLKEVQRPRFSTSPLMPYFEGLIVSDEIGVAKPHPAIFDAAFSLLGQPAKHEVLMIGDSLSSDIQGGINYGIDTCWFNPNRKANTAHFSPTYEVSSLADISKFV